MWISGDFTPGGVLKRNSPRGVRPTQRNPDPVQDVNFATLRESAVISHPVQDWTKQAVFKTLKTIHKFAFSYISTKKTHEISDQTGRKGEDLRGQPCLRL